MRAIHPASSAEANGLHIAIIGSGAGQTLGVMVDVVHEVVEVGADQIDEPPQFGPHIEPEYLQGMLRLREQILPLLDTRQVLSVEQLASLGA